MSDEGTAYILNMCDQIATVTLNGETGLPIPAITDSGKPSEPYDIQAISAPRVPDPRPFQRFVFGSGRDSSENKLAFYLGSDRSGARNFTIGITQDELHLEKDCQIFLFYVSVILRYEGVARFYPAYNNGQLEA